MKKAPQPPAEAREKPARPVIGGKVREAVTIPYDDFVRIIKQLRTNELLGPAAADALEAAAGLAEEVNGQSPKAKELRTKVAAARDEDADTTDTKAEDEPKKKPKKKAMMFAAEEPEEIPEKKTAAVVEKEEEPEEAPPKEEEEPPELNLNPKQNKMRTDVEMWLMDEIPSLYGVGDSEELDESLQEDGQATAVTKLIGLKGADEMTAMLKDWLKGAPDTDAVKEFSTSIIEKITAIQDAGKKKKKKKKDSD